ncbi:MAG: protein jag [Spirochaetes bacterium]|nr:protein jag [Spirochaetota bacterium]
MEYEFEGRTETEAVDRAVQELGLGKDDFDITILEEQKSGLFKKGYVKIRVHTDKIVPKGESKARVPDRVDAAVPAGKPRATFAEPAPQDEFEEKLVGFMEGVIERMGYPGKLFIQFRENHKIGLRMESSHSSILIGKKGKNLDALQLLANIYASRLGREDMRVVLDTENYRIRREESLVRMAYSAAERVRSTRGSILLEPMNPFDRWLIHTTLNDISDVHTKSEGDGLYKQVRVFYRGYG